MLLLVSQLVSLKAHKYENVLPKSYVSHGYASVAAWVTTERVTCCVEPERTPAAPSRPRAYAAAPGKYNINGFTYAARLNFLFDHWVTVTHYASCGSWARAVYS